MRAIIQRVKKAKVEVENIVTGEIGKGLLIFLGVGENDTEKDCSYLVDKIANLRVFPDENDLMNLSLIDINGSALIISQFTLLGDCRKGRRPSFAKAAHPEKANQLYEYFIESFGSKGLKIATGIFKEMMDVSLVNDGPVTILLDSKKMF